MSSKFDETINQFKVGDLVKKRGSQQVMKITSNVPGGGAEIYHYLKTDKFNCEWKDAQGNIQNEILSGSELEMA